MTAISLDPLILVPFIGGFVGMALGLVTIWSQIKNTRAKAKTDAEAANLATETRLKEFFELKFSIFDVKIDSIKHDMQIQDETYTRKLEDRSKFFMGLLEKLEEKIKDE